MADMTSLRAIDLQTLPRDVDVLLGVIADLQRQYGAILESLSHQLANLRHRQFGASSERSAPQPELFTDTVTLPVPPVETVPVAAHDRKRRGRPKLPADLPRQRIEYDLTDAEKAEFERVEKIGEEVSETLDYTPAKLIVIEHARAKYRCEKDGASTIRTAQAEPSPLPKCNASAGLLAQVMVAKYADGLPLARQERIFARHGVAISRTTLCDWILGCADKLSVLMPLLKQHVLGAPVIFGDDTTVDLLEEGRGKARTARMWAWVSAGARQQEDGTWQDYPKAAYVEFSTTREAIHPPRFLQAYRGYLQADDYAGYHATFATGRVVHVACWAHARRRYHEVARKQKTPGLAHDALRFIGKLYEIEGRLRDKPPDVRLAMRREETVPLLAEFKSWLEGHYPTLLPQGPLAQAFGYTLSNWQALLRFTTDGILVPDSNLVERTLRPIAVGRKAWLFVASERGGAAAATAFSLIETCKMHGIEPYAWLKDVMARLSGHRTDRLAELLPFHWTPQA